MKRAPIVAYLFCLAADVFLARLELHTDDAGIVALCIVACTLILGCMHPRRAWQWALLVGPSVPAADLCWGRALLTTHNIENLGMLSCFVVVLGLVGSYSGFFVRHAISAVAGPAR